MNCKIEKCENSSYVRGLCRKHYTHFYKNGTVHLYTNKLSIFDKIMALIVKQETPSKGTPVFINGVKTQCWLYQGTCPEGYGQIRDGHKKLKTHRYIYWWFFLKDKNIELKKEDQICHKCDTPNCCNPDHLYLGTIQDNVDDMIKKGRDKKARGEGCHNKLTENDVWAIRLESGTHQNIADKYNVSRSLIGAIKNHKIWKWLN
jgi:hypothetical protein